MKRSLCAAFVSLLFAVGLQAEEKPEFIELKGHTDIVLSVAFSPDGKTVLTGEQHKSVRLWDAETGKELRKFEPGVQAWHSVAFMPDGKKVVTRKGIWDVNTGEKIQGNIVWDCSVAVSPDGKKIATTHFDQRVAKIWDAETGKVLHTLKGHTNSLYAIAFSPDGKTVVTCSEDATLRMWDTETGMQVNVIENTRTLSISFSPDGKKMVTTDGFNANILDAASGKKLLKLGKDGGFDERIHNPHNGHVGNVFSATFSPDGKYIVTTARGEGPCRIWDAELGKELCWLPHSDAVICAVFSPDGKKVVTGQEKTARIWDWERLPKLYVPPKVRDF